MLRETIVQDPLGDSNEVIPYLYSITSYGADYTVDGLVRRMSDGSIYVPPFQRGFVWNIKDASRFVESLLLGLPVPGIFLSKDPGTQKLLVIDGQQRLKTLHYFYEGIFEPTGRVFALAGVQSVFEHATYKSLSDPDRRRLDDSILHATVVKQDEPSDDQSSIYHIFERINTGGTRLQAQEIRTCIYHGPFSDLLKHLNTDAAWRQIYGPISSTMRDQELILRFLALYFDDRRYKKPMKAFLNAYMGRNRYLDVHSEEEVQRAFSLTIDTVLSCIGSKAFRPKRALNAAVFDAVMVGVARRLESGPLEDCGGLRYRYEQLLDDHDFVLAGERATADEEQLSRRLGIATRAFSDLR